ncbi:MAG TPA: helix-turn-helix domain-containing protein [Paraburkholderia sp.]|nr:helix-turn-helix domain-containing protein [Paraburkholderia sp.]
MEFRVRSTSDVHDHSLAVSGWEQVYNQLTPGRFESVVMQAQASDFLFFRESTNRRVAQTGVAPRELSSVALPLQRPVSGTFQGCRLDGYALWLLGSGEEFRFYTPETMHYLGVSIPTSDLHALAIAVLGEKAVALLTHNVVPVPTDEGERVGAELSRFLDAFQRQPAAFTNPAASKRFRDEILSMLLELFNPWDADKRDVTHATYTEIVKRSERLLREHAEEPQTVLDLCTALRCSRRTLQTSFQRVANVSPIEYLRSVRLNGVRRLLRSTSQDELMVGDAAAQWGFTHPSYFAREYRDLFGELPSQTPRKG